MIEDDTIDEFITWPKGKENSDPELLENVLNCQSRISLTFYNSTRSLYP
ncbi:2012_t:CDS:2 [Scutellospora calospora]|uniref:2012_t:CDS:1 n=1 Tax=Scutellospora calospora TaxID=85575 RepID=A0ACA9K5G4_9GLOM|nr:2012_t:CDS:2 [Scutellospora calospora]